MKPIRWMNVVFYTLLCFYLVSLIKLVSFLKEVDPIEEVDLAEIEIKNETTSRAESSEVVGQEQPTVDYDYANENSTLPKTLKNDTLSIPDEKIDTNKMTVVITTYKQPICLERMILLLRSCPIIAEIRVNWFVQDQEPTTFNEITTNHRIPVIFDKYPDKLSYRFHPRNFTTDAVFSVDVDSFYSCQSLTMLFDAWKQNKRSAVGFHGRYLTYDGYAWEHSFEDQYEYNTLFITKGGITHRNMFDL